MGTELRDPARHAFLRLSAGALAAFAARGALAQFRDRSGRGERSGRGGAEGRQPTAEDRLDESLREFHDDLALGSAQQPAWDRYARALRGYVQDAARDRYAAMEDIAGAATALYAALDPAQQQRANPRLAGVIEMVAGDVPAATPAQAKREHAGRGTEHGEP
jgi:hypothetical protein